MPLNYRKQAWQIFGCLICTYYLYHNTKSVQITYSHVKYDYKGFLFTSLYSKYRDRVLPNAAYLKSYQIKITFEKWITDKNFFSAKKQGTRMKCFIPLRHEWRHPNRITSLNRVPVKHYSQRENSIKTDFETAATNYQARNTKQNAAEIRWKSVAINTKL